MEDAKLLLAKKKTGRNFKNTTIQKGYIIYHNRDRVFNGFSIDNLLSDIHVLRKRYPKIKMPIIINLGQIEFADKLTYVFLEIICYILIKEYGYPVVVEFKCKHNIWIEGISSSPLLLLNNTNKKSMYKYLEKFESDIYKKHYRKVMGKNEDKEDLSKRMDDIAYFLKYLGVNEDCIDELSEVTIELAGNAWEHAEAECLIDVDVTEPYLREDTEGRYFGINISVVNFSEKLLGDALKDKMQNWNGVHTERYKVVEKAHKNHSNFFDELYTEEDFYNIASFQHKISGSMRKDLTGGTGLTKLISSLEKRSDSHRCYLISGNRAVWFYHQYLEYDKEGWLGFNDENDFLNRRPANGVFTQGTIYMPGTAYNLNFVIKGD